MESDPRGPTQPARQLKLRALAVTLGMTAAFLAVGGQLARLAWRGDGGLTLAAADPVAGSFARPDIVDRNGRLIATDIATPSLYADPGLVLDRDEVAEKLSAVLPELDQRQLLDSLADKSRRFVWIRRGLSPRLAQRVHDLGLPGLAFRTELRRAYPQGTLAGHMLGSVDIDNKGLTGLERYIDEKVGVEAVHGATRSDRAPVRLALDIGVQHAVEDELQRAIRRYGAEAAAGIVLDVATGEVLGSASVPGVDPSRPAGAQDPAKLDRIAGGSFELGSIMKAVTVAMAFDGGKVSPATILDVTEPLVDGTRTIRDPHPAGRPLTVAEVFTHSSNVGAALLALDAGAERQRDFLGRLALLAPISTEAGPVAAPQVPQRFERIESITVSYGHGLAVAPIQFAAAAAALVNGGEYVAPTLIRMTPGGEPRRTRVISPSASESLNALMRLNVTDAAGTGRRAEVPGYGVGGKTGTAEIAEAGKYRKDRVISSFLAAFPMSRPRYVVLVSLFEPKPSPETQGEIAAGVNAAPSAGRLIRRVAPLLGVLPEGALAEAE
jgi:cell division protein FtsI (penicillin-binding protein 3)